MVYNKQQLKSGDPRFFLITLMMTTDESLFDGEVRCFDGDKHNNPIPLDDDHDVYPSTGTTSGTALSIISICDPLMLLKSRYLPGPI